MGVGQIARDLHHPLLAWLTRDPGDLDRARPELHGEEDGVADQTAEGQDLDGQKVSRCQRVPMSGEGSGSI